jgi:hypothetical protein
MDFITNSLGYLAYIPVLIACFNIGPFNILNLIARGFGYTCYTMSNDYNSEEIKTILHAIKDTSYSTEKYLRNSNIVLRGFFFSKEFIGHYDGYLLWMYVREERFLQLSKPTCVNYIHENTEIEKEDEILEKEKETECDKISIYEFNNSYKFPSFHSRNVNLSYIVPTIHQQPVIQEIYKIFKKKGRASIWIDGCPGSGKSTIGLLLAKKICGSYCHTFNPTIPSMDLNDLRNERDSTPLVITIEESDKIINAIHTDSVKLNERYYTAVHDKSSFNRFMDDLYLYPNIIFLFTSNVKKSEIDVLDASYLRKGRIHAYFTMDTVYSFD